MLKSKSQSMEAPLALSSKNFLLLSNTNWLIWNNTTRTGVQTTLFKQTKQTKKSKRKLRRSKNNTTVHETIKTKCLERPELFIDEEGDSLGIPKPWRLYFLNISWGDMGWNPQAWAFVHSSSHYIILALHLKFFLHTKLHTIFISNISVFKIIRLWVLVSTQVKLPLKHKLLYQILLKAQVIKKNSKRNRLRGKCT